MARASILLLFAFALACDSDGGPQVLDTRVITPDGANPLTIGEFALLRITWAQSGFETVTREVDLTGDTFEVGFDLDPVASARARVELIGPSGTLHGAPPFFSPLASGGLLWIVVGEPGTCARVARFEAPEPARADSAYVYRSGFLVQLGGVADSGPTSAVTFSDLYWSEAGNPLLELLEPVGPTKAAIFGESKALVLAEGGAWTYELDGSRVEGDERAVPTTLFDSAGIGSAIARSTPGAVLVAGGGDATSLSRDLARVAGDGPVQLGGLIGPRAFAGAAPAGESDVVVVGGTLGASAPFAEWIDMATLGSTTVTDPAAERVRNEPLVIAGESSHWIVGGTDEMGAPISTSWVLSGCPAACVLEPGPEVDLGLEPRNEGTTVTDGLSVYTAVEAGGWRLEPIGDLVRERRGAGVATLESGVVLIHGGRDDVGPHLDGELCFPAVLNPLE